jgi:subtilase family serine protease
MKKVFGFKTPFLGFIISTLLFAGMNLPVSVLAQGPENLPQQALSHKPVCPGRSNEGSVNCHARVVVDPHGKPASASKPYGYGPVQLRGGYNLGSGTVAVKSIIAIVDAYDHPNIAKDLATYSRQYNLPQLGNCAVSTATAAKPCFQKVDQNGGTKYPVASSDWALEISLDVETVHAICQNCSILLVEASTSSYQDIMTAFDRAVAMGANVISNSYGSMEFSSETNYDFHFSNAASKGIAVTFSSGDSGYATQYPAASPYVTAVGGTALTLDSSNNRVSEIAWTGAGSGCSVYEAQPLFQTGLGLSGCANRMIADVSANADPNTGAAVYDSYSYYGSTGWFTIGGTSLASPIIAATYALAGNSATIAPANQYLYSHTGSLYDVTSGSNGTCSITYLCNAIAGYDGPTGLGTPSGLGAF